MEKKSDQKKTVHYVESIHDAIVAFKEGKSAKYTSLLSELSSDCVKSSHLLKWYQEGVTYAYLLDKRFTGLVNALLNVQWTDREKEVVYQFDKFVSTLIMCNPTHLRAVLVKLSRLFQSVSMERNSIGKGYDPFVFETIHKILENIFSTIPQSLMMVEKIFSENFPFMKKPIWSLDNYVKHLLLMTSYQPCLRPAIIKIIFRNLVQLDCHSPKHEIEELDYDDCSQENIFQMDEDIEGHEDDDTEAPGLSVMKHPLANKLDVLLHAFYQYIYNVCYKGGLEKAFDKVPRRIVELSLKKIGLGEWLVSAVMGKLQLDEARKLFREIVFAFERVVLPIYQLGHVQFCVFYICSFKQSFYDSFIDFCWKKVINVNECMIIRKTSACYIASLLARANYISLSSVKTSLEVMSAWCHYYLKQSTSTSSSSSSNFTACEEFRHGVFYTVCQALFYVIIFRHLEILDSERGHNFILSLNMHGLILSSLNPLKVCLGSVVQLFAHTMREHQLVYCDSITARNNRMGLPIAGTSTSDESQKNFLESFFPFDPYLLKKSASFIEPLYTEWTGAQPSSKSLDLSEKETFGASTTEIKPISPMDDFNEKLISGSFSPGFGLSLTPDS